MSLTSEKCYLSVILLVSLKNLTFLAFFPSSSPNKSVNCICALNFYVVLEGVIYVKGCLISRELGTSNILTICCQIVHQKTPFSLPETGESLANDFLYSDVCRVETGENCTSPAPKEGRTPWLPAPGDYQTSSVMYMRQVVLEAD